MPDMLLQYKVLEEMGRGRHSVVYKACHPARQQLVALKILGQPEIEHPNLIWTYLTPLERARQLHHPGICEVLEVVEYEGALLIVEEYLEGQPLDRILASSAWSTEQFLATALQLSRALAFAHGQDVIHGNMKLSNIFVLTDDTVRITDFAVPRIRTDIEETATVLPPWEQIYLDPGAPDPGTPTQEADLYALGVIFYELLAGPTAALAARNAAAGKPATTWFDPRSLHQSGVSGEIVLMIERLLTPNHSERCTAAGELVVTLESIGDFRRKLEESAPAPRSRYSARAYFWVSLIAVLLLAAWVLIASEH